MESNYLRGAVVVRDAEAWRCAVYVRSECTSSAKMGVGCAFAWSERRRGWAACDVTGAVWAIIVCAGCLGVMLVQMM